MDFTSTAYLTEEPTLTETLEEHAKNCEAALEYAEKQSWLVASVEKLRRESQMANEKRSEIFFEVQRSKFLTP